MTFTLFTLSTLITTSALFSLVQGSPVPQGLGAPCRTTIKSVQGDTCRSIGGAFGMYDYNIQQANTFLNCNDIWPGTSICVPNMSYNGPVIYREDLSTNPRCQAQQYSIRGDNCRTIGNQWALYDYQIWNANTWVNCNDLWPGTLLCIPNLPRETTVIYTGNAQATPTGPPSTITTTATTSTTTQSAVTTSQTTTGPNGGCASTYMSKQGDTCQSIGRRWGISEAAVLGSNSFLNCNDIWTGTPICIPYWAPVSMIPICGARYIAVQGDTCDSIAYQYSFAPSFIKDANSFVNCSDIWAGTPICIPAFYPGKFDPPCRETYTSVQGDTCNSIGDKLGGVNGGEISIANPHLNCNDIWSGTPICIPVRAY